MNYFVSSATMEALLNHAWGGVAAYHLSQYETKNRANENTSGSD